MTEIEKMFENAGIRICKRKQGFTLKDCTDRECKECGYYNYPDFTAEKQLELIKWLAKIYELRINWVERDNSYHFVIRDYTNRRLSHSVCNYEVPFEETLAYLINRIWLSLTEQDKEEIRRIWNE